MIDRKFVTYEEFGAKGDGVTDDIESIYSAHEFANKNNVDIIVKSDGVYYVSGKDRTVEIQTNVDFGTAEFIIDDTNVENRHSHIFKITSKLQKFTPDIKSLTENQKKIDLNYSGECFVCVTNANKKRYIRFGPNQNDGTSQCDCFIVSANGEIKNQIIWDFDEITSITAYPIDEETLTVKGGKFTTIANCEESFYRYYSRGFSVARSNTIIDGISHFIKGEGDTGAPYGGFISISDCAYVTVKNSFFTGHKIYDTIGSAGAKVSMGSYDLNVNSSSDVSFINCKQDEIMNRSKWGLIGTNFCKRLSLDGCIFSRFDAHMGVTDCVIKNSTLGWQCLNAIGHGTFIIENTNAFGWSFINLRSDYGSTWKGDMIIKNCMWRPSGVKPAIISADNKGTHDFGYTCTMPENITVENLRINDFEMPENYAGVTVFNNFDPDFSEDSEKPYPYIQTKTLTIKNIRTDSGRPIQIKTNEKLLKNLKIINLADNK